MHSSFSGFQIMFIRLLDYSMDVSLLICLIFIIKFLSHKKLPAWWHYSLWLMLLIRMLVPLELEKYLNLSNFLPGLSESAILELPSITINATSSTHGGNHQIESILLFIWLSGVIVFGVYTLYRNLNFWMTIKSKPLLTDKRLLDLLEECKRRMKIHTVLGVVITDKVKSPALFGYFRPRLLLPEGTLEKLNDTELAYIFMHELGHLKHHDLGISWLLSIMQIIHWFNPLVWLAFYQMRVDQETACDASVLSRLDHSRSTDYANAIIGFLEKFRQNRPLPALAGIMETKSQTKRRIAMITDYKSFSRKKTVVAFALLVSICFISLSLSCVSGVSGVKRVDTVKEYTLEEIDTPPRVIHTEIPKYPYEAKIQKIEGSVLVGLIVTKEGIARDVSVFESSHDGIFDQAALESVKQSKYNPGTKDGEPVDTKVVRRVVFKLPPDPTVPSN